MVNFDDNPIRLSQPGHYTRPQLPIGEITTLPTPKWPNVEFGHVLNKRRSAEKFQTISLDALSNWLFFCCATQAVDSSDENRQRRFVASFGALHPHHVLLGSPDGRWHVYIPERHALGELTVQRNASFRLRDKARLHHDCPAATLIALIANSDLVRNYYQHANALLLRDAGVLLGHGQLVAAAFGLAYRIIGCSGAPESLELLSPIPFRPAATGLAWIGLPPNR